MAKPELERDILTQVQTWQASLGQIEAGVERFRAVVRPEQLDTVLVTGCGSSYYLAQAVAGAAWAAGIRAVAVPSSDVLLGRVDPGRISLAVGLSRSGETTEVVQAIRKMRAKGVPTVGLSTRGGSELLDAATVAVALPEGKEQTIVMTKSFSTLLLGAVALLEGVQGGSTVVNAIRGMGSLPSTAFAAITATVGDAYPHYVFLGSGPFYGTAGEAMLKMKEMAYVWSEAYHPLELRHGFESTVDANTLVVLLASSDQAILAMERPIVSEMEQLGAKTLILEAPPDADLVAPGFRDAIAAIATVPYLQYLAWAQCLASGVDPNTPRHQTPVVKLGPGNIGAV